jgi:hypothetical protein
VKSEPLLATILNDEKEPEPEKKPKTNTNQPINTDTLISNKSAIVGRLKTTYDFIKQKHRELGPFKIELVPDQEAIKILLREGKAFFAQAGYIAPTEA